MSGVSRRLANGTTVGQSPTATTWGREIRYKETCAPVCCLSCPLPWPASAWRPPVRACRPPVIRRATPPADPAAFVAQANATLLEEATALARAQWVAANFITEDTEQLSAAATASYVAISMRLAKDAASHPADGGGNADVARQLLLLKLAASPLPAPADDALQKELTRIVAGMEAGYGRGKYCPPGKPCQTIDDLGRLMATNRDPKTLLEAWEGWHAIAPPLKQPYERFVQLGNQGAKELGFADLGAFWRAGYDMPPDDFAKEVDRLWTQVKPLYDQLHAHVRRRLVAKYGATVVPPGRPHSRAPARQHVGAAVGQHLRPRRPSGPRPAFDLTGLLKAKKTDARGMVKYGEGFFTSLGFAPLPETFWKRSLFTRPQDRDVVCHASAWDIDNVDDLRIKMCIEINAEDFVTVHHELGHNFYQRAYNTQPFLYRTGANDGFHEAIGDAVALSITPQYLVKVGLLPAAPKTQDDVEFLLRMALDKVAFLPFGLLVDQWRWKVFSGEIPPAQYNDAWWALREQYQGVAAPGAAARGRVRSGREVPRAGQHAVHALLPRAHPAVPDAPRDVQGRGTHGAAAHVLDLRQQGGRRAPAEDAGDGREQAVAGGARGAHGREADGRDRDPRLLRAAASVARRRKPSNARSTP